jgi:hypothetical protein
MDPHFYAASPNISVAMHVFDRLTHRSPDAGWQREYRNGGSKVDVS